MGSIGSAGHLCTVKLEQAAASAIAIVPYKGTGPALMDVISGVITMNFSSLPPAVSQIKGGRLKAVLAGPFETPEAFDQARKALKDAGFRAILARP